jgi:glycosyltransferase involved in cell wall biosynthesis
MDKKLRIAFYAGASLPIHAESLAQRPLGGTETALIRVAALLDQRGHDVTVFTTHREPPASKPRYLPNIQVLQSGEFDVFVVIQDWRALFFPVRAKHFCYWTGDSFKEYANFGLGDKRVIARAKRFFAVSKFHAQSICEHSGFPPEKARVIGNGVELSYFNGEETRQPNRLIYSSAPYRGLALMPAIFSELKKIHRDLELHVFSGFQIYDTDKPFQGPQVAEFEKIKAALGKLPGCFLHGNIVQSALARELMRSSIYVYPNFVLESCCITAMEAQAAGCAVVTSALGALPEIIGQTGILIPGNPGEPSYMQNFTQAVHTLLTQPKLVNQIGASAKEKAFKEFSWEKAADRFEAALEELEQGA